MKTLILLAALVAAPLFLRGTETIDSSHPYSYGGNIGWMNWTADSPANGVVVGEFVCSGWIWGANVGWINLGSGSPANHIQYLNNSATDFGVNYQIDPTQPGYGMLRGYAYGANIGWINFEATGNPRVSLLSGALSGYAYSANCGWINLNDAAGNFVKTDHLAMGIDTNANGIADAWEYTYFGHLLSTGGQNSASPNGNGMTLLQDYLAAANPLAIDNGLYVIAFSAISGGSATQLTFTSNAGRLYTIEVNTDLTKPLNWADSGLGLFAPDGGTNTTRSVSQPSTAKRFFRVKTMRPLP